MPVQSEPFGRVVKHYTFGLLLRANLRIPQKRTTCEIKFLRKLQNPCQTIRKKITFAKL